MAQARYGGTPVTVAFAEYPNETGAKQVLDTLEQMERDGAVHVVDAAVLVKEPDGKAKITDTARRSRRRSLGAGAIAGGVLGLIFPPSLLVGAGLGAAVGGIVGALRHRDAFSNAEMRQAAESMAPGTSAIVAVVEERWLDQLRKAAQGYDRLVTQGLEAEAAGTVTAVEAQAASEETAD